MNQQKTDLPDNEQTPAASDPPEAGNERSAAAAETPAASDDKVDERDRHEDETEARSAETGESGDDDEIAALREALQRASDEADRYRDQALRAVAEAENARKRAQRDVESARKFALEKFATELLGVRDSLEMGLKATEQADADTDRLIEGMELTGRMLASAMEKFGIEVINPEGEAFNPELHEAVSTHATDAQAPNTVVSVMQKGYTLNGRVLRAAMVVVAKAPSDDA